MSIVPSELDLNRAIRGYIKSALNIPVLPANSNYPVPTGSYATALQVSDMRNGFSFSDTTYNSITDKIEATIFSNRLLTYSIQIYRDSNVLGLARLLSFWGSTPSGEYYLNTNNLALIDWSNVRDLTSLIDGESEPRASIDLTFGKVVAYEQEVDRIASIDVNYSIQDSDIINDNNQIGE